MEFGKNYKWMMRKNVAHLVRMNWETMLNETVISGVSPQKYSMKNGFCAVMKNGETCSAALFDNYENDFVWKQCNIAEMEFVRLPKGENKADYLDNFAYQNFSETFFRLWTTDMVCDVLGERIFSNFYYTFNDKRVRMTGFFPEYPQDGFRAYEYVELIYNKDFVAALLEEGYYEVYNAKGYQSTTLHLDLNLSGAVQLKIRDGKMVKEALTEGALKLERAKVVGALCYVSV